MNLSAGTIVDEKFEIIGGLGSGGFGVIYRARHIFLERTIALKLLDVPEFGDEDVQRFKREAQILCSLQHSRLPLFYGYGVWEGRPYMAMELLVGNSLQALLDQKGSLDPAEAISITKQICEGLECAHKAGIVHRDLKPANIMLVNSADSRGSTVKIIDFGLAKVVDRNLALGQDLTKEGMAVGSVEYMSPEQCFGKRADARSDIYALGCMLYRFLSGHTPFPTDHIPMLMKQHCFDEPTPLNEALPAAPSSQLQHLQAVIEQCMEKDPQLRYQSVEELAADLGASGRVSSRRKAISSDSRGAVGTNGSHHAGGSHSSGTRSQRGKLLAIACATIFSAAAVGAAFFLQPQKTQTDDTRNAFDEYNEALRFDVNPDAHGRLEAARHFERALLLDEKEHRLLPEQTIHALDRLALNLLERGDPTRARAVSQAAIQLTMQLPPPLVAENRAGEVFGVASARLNQSEQALPLIEQYSAYLAKNSELPWVHSQLGFAATYNGARKPLKALEAIAKAENLNQATNKLILDDLMFEKAKALRQLGREPEAKAAEEIAKRAAALEPTPAALEPTTPAAKNHPTEP